MKIHIVWIYLLAYCLPVFAVECGNTDDHSVKSKFETLHCINCKSAYAYEEDNWEPVVTKFAELIDRIKKEHSKEEIRILMFSGSGEEHIGEKIEQLARSKVYLVKNMSLREVAGIINYCSCFIGNDNGLFHIAVALGIPTITIFGPENPLEWHPYGYLQKEKHIVISKNLPCVNCGKMYCEKHNCIDSITVDEVFEKLLKGV